VLLVKTLRSTTFKLALISIGVFGAVVIALFGYVYWSTTSFVLSGSDSAIEAERTTLRNIYDMSGREALIQAIEQRSGTALLEGSVYLLADQSFAPVAGNLKKWPAVNGAGQWSEFGRSLARPFGPAPVVSSAEWHLFRPTAALGRPIHPVPPYRPARNNAPAGAYGAAISRLLAHANCGSPNPQ
jgi:hypothetical protein